jgi:hypothetical protein
MSSSTKDWNPSSITGRWEGRKGLTGPWLTKSTGCRPSCPRSFRRRLFQRRQWGSSRRSSRWGLRGARPFVCFMCRCGSLKNAIAKCRKLHNLNSKLTGIQSSKREEEEVSTTRIIGSKQRLRCCFLHCGLASLLAQKRCLRATRNVIK